MLHVAISRYVYFSYKCYNDLILQNVGEVSLQPHFHISVASWNDFVVHTSSYGRDQLEIRMDTDPVNLVFKPREGTHGGAHTAYSHQITITKSIYTTGNTSGNTLTPSSLCCFRHTAMYCEYLESACGGSGSVRCHILPHVVQKQVQG